MSGFVDQLLSGGKDFLNNLFKAPPPMASPIPRPAPPPQMNPVQSLLSGVNNNIFSTSNPNSLNSQMGNLLTGIGHFGQQVGNEMLQPPKKLIQGSIQELYHPSPNILGYAKNVGLPLAETGAELYGLAKAPLNSLLGGGGFGAGLNTISNLINKQPLTKNLPQSIGQGTTFMAQLGAIGGPAETLMNPIASRLAPSNDLIGNIARGALKQFGVGAGYGAITGQNPITTGIQFAPYGILEGLRPVKTAGKEDLYTANAPIDILVSHEGAPDRKTVEMYKQKIMNGEKIDPIIITSKGESNGFGIEDGQHRFQAYKELGIKQVPIIFKGGQIYNQMMKMGLISSETNTIPQNAELKNLLQNESPSKTTIEGKQQPMGENVLNPQAGNLSSKPNYTPLNVNSLLKPPLEGGVGGEKPPINPSEVRSGFLGIRNSRIGESNQLALDIEKILPKDEQQAVSLYREIKNRPDLQEKLLTMLKSDDPFYKPYRDIITKALNPTDQMKQADTMLGNYFSGRLKEGTDLGYLKSDIQDYISHIGVHGEDSQTFENIPSRPTMTRRTPFGQARGITDEGLKNTFVDLLENKKTPATFNSSDIVRIYGERDAVANATHQFINTAKESGLGKWFSPGQVPEGWRSLDPYGRKFENSIPFLDKEGKPGIARQVFAVPGKIADAMKPVLEPDWLKKVGGIGKWRWAQSWAKYIQLSLSFFHAKALTLTAWASDPRVLKDSAFSDMGSPLFKEAELDLLKHRGTSPILGGEFDAYRNIRQQKGNFLTNNPLTKAFDFLANKTSGLTFDIIQRKYKVIDYSNKVASWMADHPNATEEQLNIFKDKTGRYVNDAYGGLNWEDLGLSKSQTTLLRTFLLAPDWTFSNLLMFPQMLKGKIPLGSSSAFVASSFITGIVLTQLTNKLLNGKFSNDPFNVTIGQRKNGAEVKANMYFAGTPKDLVSLFTKGPIDFLVSKAAPFTRQIGEIMSNRDSYTGEQIRNPEAGPIQNTIASVKHLIGGAPVPFSISSPIKQFTSGKGEATPLELILGGTGLGQITTHNPRTDAYNKVRYALGQGDPTGKDLKVFDAIQGLSQNPQGQALKDSALLGFPNVFNAMKMLAGISVGGDTSKIDPLYSLPTDQAMSYLTYQRLNSTAPGSVEEKQYLKNHPEVLSVMKARQQFFANNPLPNQTSSNVAPQASPQVQQLLAAGQYSNPLAQQYLMQRLQYVNQMRQTQGLEPMDQYGNIQGSKNYGGGSGGGGLPSYARRAVMRNARYSVKSLGKGKKIRPIGVKTSRSASKSSNPVKALLGGVSLKKPKNVNLRANFKFPKSSFNRKLAKRKVRLA